MDVATAVVAAGGVVAVVAVAAGAAFLAETQIDDCRLIL